jgi:hypothetical protein
MDQAAIALVARTMLSLYGGQAVIELRRHAVRALDRGDDESFAAWQAILQAVRKTTPPPSAA